ncbi:MAG: hypothetical protein Q4G61_07510 [Tissierellia bacterium]|nr:hypothetical protein [Tissierellia bacterium]
MNTRIEKLLKLMAFACISILVGLYMFKYKGMITTPIEWFDVISESIGYSMMFIILFERLLWRLNPISKLPKLKKNYSGILKYKFNDNEGEKKVKLSVNQTYLTVTVKLYTDEITSKTLTSELLEENGEYILVYTYQTNPKSAYSENNPIQIGTCKLSVINDSSLEGVYWTNRKTIGDLSLTSIE